MRKKNIYLILIITLLVLTSSFILYKKTQNKINEISYIEFIDYLEDGKVEEVTLKDSSKIEVLLNNDLKIQTDNPRTENFKQELLAYDVKVIEEDIETKNIMLSIAIFGVLISLIFYFRDNASKQAEKEMTNMSKIDTVNYNENFKFADVAGNEEAKESLKEMVDFIQNPEVYNEFGARLPRGVLLYGPPGTGKTLLAKALAGEAGVPIFPVSGSDFIQVYSGLGASRIRDLFKMAKSAGKSVIFIDEIDSLGKKRKGNNGASNEEGDRTLNALLAEMSGFKENEGIIVIAATNRIDVLDDALLRPGRFDRQIEVQLPDIKAREEILKLHGKNKPLSKDIDFRRIALETVYFSGAKLENLLNESAMIAVRSKKEEITRGHIDQAYYKILVGDEKKDRSSLKRKDREITAYHEAGHALMAKLVSPENRVTRVSIIPSTKGMGGFSLNIPPDRMYQTKKEILNNIMVILGGRAAEEIIYGKENITTGASSDLEKATEDVLSMIGIYGMDEDVGLLNYNVIMSREFTSDIDLVSKGKKILGKLYIDTMKYLDSSINQLENLAKALLEKEVLEEEEINEILAKDIL
ncbi:MAG TPA: ATP-dependent metallopeptidase FtsH/Yme1/Tma family protein [Tissierellaceae bacterium]|nr:ATP-dependent metallopeptidase FtsH/Yme1/Tma family protein [Tissierellaceae bacterium]